MASVLSSGLQLFVPQPCYDEFFIKFNFFHVACLKIVLSKCLGYAIILGSLIVKVPQIIKIVRAQSAQGLSFLGTMLELMAITATLAYSFSQGHPFSAYGEAVFLTVQTLIVAFLVLFYSGQTGPSVVFTTVYIGLLGFLLSPAAPQKLLWFLQASVMPNIVVARMIQVFTNYKNGSTGQLSAITVFMLAGGSAARVFTSIQETGDPVVIMVYVAASSCNAIIATQMLYYWNAQPKTKAE